MQHISLANAKNKARISRQINKIICIKEADACEEGGEEEGRPEREM